MSSQKYKVKINNEYKETLTKHREPGHSEREMHEYLEKRPSLLPYVYNCYSSIVVSEYQLSGTIDRKPDFLYCSFRSDGAVVYMVEIEAPHKKMFKMEKKRVKFTADFKQAYDQIDDWEAWVNIPGNKAVLLETIRKLCGTPRTPSNIAEVKYILIYGSRDELNSPDKISMKVAKSKGQIEVMTFDRLEHSSDDMIVVKPENDFFRPIEVSEDYEVNSAYHDHFDMLDMVNAIDRNIFISDDKKEDMIEQVRYEW
ncbi:Shedu immune nuclease family protein [Bacillus paramycoides]|uniref:Shedu immune nuclease family protein n=1 Tax=Bacillus paramycoides TaxID=2026194 RepID=UPI003D1FF67D